MRPFSGIRRGKAVRFFGSRRGLQRIAPLACPILSFPVGLGQTLPAGWRESGFPCGRFFRQKKSPPWQTDRFLAGPPGGGCCPFFAQSNRMER
ncbi:MAG: hypothetical protein CW346_19155 [Bacillaceae bacterium]|nr:hypothetical protein [Bacillaceae bacterium]